jgi:hypothetical protein
MRPARIFQGRLSNISTEQTDVYEMTQNQGNPTLAEVTIKPAVMELSRC